MSDVAVTHKPSVFDRIWNKPPQFWVQLLCVLLLLVSLQTVLILTVSGGMKYATADRIYGKDEVTALADSGVLEDVDCILVLGAGLRQDGTPSGVLFDRVQAAVDVYASGEGHILLMSGDQTGSYDEPASMTAAAVALGASADDILQDKQGYSTYESLWRLKQMEGVHRVVIVTQEYHLYRAMFIADRLGLEAVGVAADSPAYRPTAKDETREILARFRDMFRTERGDAIEDDGIPVMAQ